MVGTESLEVAADELCALGAGVEVNYFDADVIRSAMRPEEA